MRLVFDLVVLALAAGAVLTGVGVVRHLRSQTIAGKIRALKTRGDRVRMSLDLERLTHCAVCDERIAENELVHSQSLYFHKTCYAKEILS